MAWMEKSVVEQRAEFVLLVQTGEAGMALWH